VVEYHRPFSLLNALQVKTNASVFKLDRTMLYELGTPEVLYLWSAGTRSQSSLEILYEVWNGPVLSERRRWTLLAAAWVCVGGCAFSKTPKMNLIAVDPNGNGFVDQRTGRQFVPFGTNYYDPNTGWPPKIWQQFNAERVAQQFKIMKLPGRELRSGFSGRRELSAGCHTVNPEALGKLDAMLKIARRTGIRLI